MTATIPARPIRRDYVAPETRRAHGTRVKYVVECCRCEPCTLANREAERVRRRAMHRPDETWVPYVPAGPARRHVRTLMAQGAGLKTIAALAGISTGGLSKLLYGDYKGRKPSKRIRPETARRILAVRITDVAGAQRIPAGPTWVLLDELLAKGWVKAHLASLIIGHPVASLQISRDTVRASTARRVEQVYVQLRDVAPPPRKSRWSA